MTTTCWVLDPCKPHQLFLLFVFSLGVAFLLLIFFFFFFISLSTVSGWPSCCLLCPSFDVCLDQKHFLKIRGDYFFFLLCVCVCMCALVPLQACTPAHPCKVFQNHFLDCNRQRSSTTSEISTFSFLCYVQHYFYYFPRCHFLSVNLAYHCLRTWRQCCSRHGYRAHDQMTAVASFWLDLRLVVVWGHVK